MAKRKRASLAPRLQFFVRMFPNGNSIVMQGSAEETVKSVLERIESRFRIPVPYQRLIHAGKQLSLEQSLGECGIQNDATVQLVAHLRSGGDNSMQEKVVSDMVRLIWHLVFYGEPKSSSSGVSDYDTLERLMKMHFKLNAFNDFVFIPTSAPRALVNLYQSHLPGHRAAADSLIRLFFDGCNSLFKKGLHVYCLPALVDFCKRIREDIGVDCIMYKYSMVSLWVVLDECVNNNNPNRKVLLKGVFDYVRELVDVLFRDLDLSIDTPKPLLMDNFFTLIEFLLPLTDKIRAMELQAWEARSSTDEDEDEDESLLAKEIYHLRLMYIQLLYKLEACFQGMEDCLDNGDVDNEGWDQYLPILDYMSILSKQIDGAKEMFRGIFMRRGRILSMLIIWYTERDEDHEWIIEHKSVLSFEARSHFALMMFPSEMHEDEEAHDILIDRSNLLVQSFCDIADERPEALQAGLSIHFLNEEGEGVGVKREWFVLICQEIFNPLNALFVPCPNDCRRFFPNSASNVNPLHLEYFTFCGRIIALALISKVKVGIAFDRVFFKQLAGECITLEDIQEADPYLYKGCKQILEMDAEFVDSDALGLTFAREVEEFGHMKVIELCPGGESLVVNSRNREKYVDLLIQNQFVTSISEQVSHFAKGFGEIIFDSKLQQFFQILDLEDFDKMLYGTENAICVEDWKAHTEYLDYKETDPQISWFWEVVRRMSPKQRKTLLFFWTSVKYLPFEGFCHLEKCLQICQSTESDNHLPSSRTCLYKLCLPLYSSMAIMEDRFSIITQEYISFGFGIN